MKISNLAPLANNGVIKNVADKSKNSSFDPLENTKILKHAVLKMKDLKFRPFCKRRNPEKSYSENEDLQSGSFGKLHVPNDKLSATAIMVPDVNWQSTRIVLIIRWAKQTLLAKP